MELTIQEQIVKLFEEKEKILLVTHTKPDGDAISSILALFLILEKIGKKNVNAVCADRIPEIFEFLPGQKSLKQKTIFAKDFVISLDCSKISVEKLKWNTEDNKLNIIIKPKDGNFLQEDVSFSESQEQFDLIVTVDVADKEQLGKLFSENTELFSTVPIVNIDHHISNTNFGSVNLVDGTASSATEVIFSLIPYLENINKLQILDENIATLLLTGIITDTGSFQNPNTTPKSFEVAAELIEHGARQQEIIRKLFKTKSLSTLKLWGSVLSKIQNDPIHRFVWSSVSAEQLKEIGATSDELVGILDDLLSNAPGAEVVMLLKEREDGIISGSIRTTTNAVDAVSIAKIFAGGGHRQASGFKIPKGSKAFEVVASDVIEKIKAYQARRLGLLENEEINKQEISVSNEKNEKPEDKLTKKSINERVLEFKDEKSEKKEVNITDGIKKEFLESNKQQKVNDVSQNNPNDSTKKSIEEKDKNQEAIEVFEKTKNELSKNLSPDELSKKITTKSPNTPVTEKENQQGVNTDNSEKKDDLLEDEAPEWLKK